MPISLFKSPHPVFFLFIIILKLSESYYYQNYDKVISVFDPEGYLLQSKYADEASKFGELILVGVSSESNIVMCRKIEESNILLKNKVNRKISKINDNCYIAYSGLVGDAIYILSELRRFSINLHHDIGALIGVTTLANRLSKLQHLSTLSRGFVID